MKKILIVEDDIHIHGLLQELLSHAGYQVTGAFSGTEAILCFVQEEFDLVLLDLMLPGKPGLEVLKEMQLLRKVPTIVLTAIENKESTVELLRAGANDYVTKPFDTEELLVRIQVQLRQGAAPAKDILTFKHVELDVAKYEATVKGVSLPLSKREFDILKCLMENPKRVFTKNNLYQQVWGEGFFGDENTVNVHISKIRNKLGKVDADNDYIQTVWGIGFKMSDQ